MFIMSVLYFVDLVTSWVCGSPVIRPMDLPKAYDCTPHDLLIAKLEAYGLDKSSLHLLRDCLTSVIGNQGQVLVLALVTGGI